MPSAASPLAELAAGALSAAAGGLSGGGASHKSWNTIRCAPWSFLPTMKHINMPPNSTEPTFTGSMVT